MAPNLQVPQGFQDRRVCVRIQYPANDAIHSTGEILVAESARNGRVVVIADKNNDNKADTERKVLIEGLNRPYGMAFWKNYLYVAETTSLKRYPYDAKAVSVGKGEEIVEMKDFDKGHWTRTIAFDPKGEKLYLGIGSESNVDAGENERRAAIHQCNPDGTGCKIFATGTRNPTTIGFYPGTNTLWASVQERDALGDDLVPDYFTHIQEGGFYGWPFSYIGANEDPRNKGKNPDLVKKTITPDVLLGAHVAVIEWKFYGGSQFLRNIRVERSSRCMARGTDRSASDSPVVFIPFKGGKPAGELETFLSGWMLGPDKREVWGRPTGVMEMKDGSLLVSDDGGNKIWRISYKK